MAWSGPGFVDALVDVNLGPSTQSVSRRGSVRDALVGLANAFGQDMLSTETWIGVDDQFEALHRAEAGLVHVMERGGVDPRHERSAKRLVWLFQQAQRALKRTVRCAVLAGKWRERQRLDTLYARIVDVWKHVSSRVACPGPDDVLLALETCELPHLEDLPSLNGGEAAVRGAAGGAFEESGTLVAVCRELRDRANQLDGQAQNTSAPSADDLRRLAVALRDLGSFGTPEIEAVEEDEMGEGVPMQLCQGVRAFLRANGSGMVLEWRHPISEPILRAGEAQSSRAKQCLKFVQGLVWGQRLNAWAEAVGAAAPVQKLRGLHVRLGQMTEAAGDSHTMPLLRVQVSVSACKPLHDLQEIEGWEDVRATEKLALLQELVGVLSTCEQSGADCAAVEMAKAFVVEGNVVGKGRGGLGPMLQRNVLASVCSGFPTVRLCAGSASFASPGHPDEGALMSVLMELIQTCDGAEPAESEAHGGLLAGSAPMGCFGEVDSAIHPKHLAVTFHALGKSCKCWKECLRFDLGERDVGLAWDALEDGSQKQLVLSVWRSMHLWRTQLQVEGHLMRRESEHRRAFACGSFLVAGLEPALRPAGAVTHSSAHAAAVLATPTVCGGREGNRRQSLFSEVGFQLLRSVRWRSCVRLRVRLRQPGEQGPCLRDLASLTCAWPNGQHHELQTQSGAWVYAAWSTGNMPVPFLVAWVKPHEHCTWAEIAEATNELSTLAEEGCATGQAAAPHCRTDLTCPIPLACVPIVAAGYEGTRGQFACHLQVAHGLPVPTCPAAIPRRRRMLTDEERAEAQYCLGRNYQYGYTVESDLTLAKLWYSQAARNGNPHAQHALARMLENGKHAVPDYPAAARWYQAAAEQGLPEAQVALGRMYENGCGVHQSFKDAEFWYTEAAHNFHADGLFALGCLYEARRNAAADRVAAVCYFAAAIQGHAEAQTALGRMYEYGRGVPQNSVAAWLWYHEAAHNGDAGGQLALGQAYKRGRGVRRDLGQAVMWIQFAANQEYPKAHPALGRMYQHGIGVDTDVGKAEGLFTTAAATEDGARARAALARLRESGFAATPDAGSGL